MKTEKVCTNECLRHRLALSSRYAALVAAGLMGWVVPATAQLLGSTNTSNNNQPSAQTFLVPVIEWDMPQELDDRPGAMIIDVQGNRDRLWMVTRFGEVRVYRLDLRNDKKSANSADFFAWSLDPVTTGTTSGLRKIRTSKDGRFVFVHTSFSVQRIDTQSCYAIKSSLFLATLPITAQCTTLSWTHDQAMDPDHPVNTLTGSDVSLDDYNDVFSAAAVLDPTESYVQRLNPNAPSYQNDVTRWYVGGSAGFCAATLVSDPCVSGVDVDKSGRFVYFSLPQGSSQPNAELGDGAIGQIDTQTCSGPYGTCKIKVWTFAKLNAADPSSPPATEPRQLQIDNDGRIWVVTGSGHLVSLDPKKDRMSKHFSEDVLPDFFGVAPDGGVVGFTDTNNNFVGLLKPVRNAVPVPPDMPLINFQSFNAAAVPGNSTRANGPASPCRKIATAVRKPTPDGTFVEADITTAKPKDGTCGINNSPVPSSMPLGITPDRNSAVGTFFYAVGNDDPAFNRVGRVRLRNFNLRARIERDDDDFDDDGKRADVDDDVDDDGIANATDADNDNDGIPNVSDDDEDNDGIENASDTKDKKETRQNSDQDVAPGAYAQDPFTVNPGTLLVVARASSTDPLTSLVVELLNSSGQVVASSLPTPGTAAVTFVPPTTGGSYTLRVKNPGTGLSTISTSILTRELWPVVALGGV